jgi:predicted TIM-barrel fold metal-dependent hydrolase
MDKRIHEIVEQTPFIDTHEHLLEESQRLSGVVDEWLFPSDDWTSLFNQYLSDDLSSSGMSAADAKQFYSPGIPVERKHRLVAPHWERIRHTGYAQAVRTTLRGLYGEDDLTADSAPRIAEKYRDMVKPGFYRKIIGERANVAHCQVNSLQRIFMETEQPDLLAQDLSFMEFARCSQHDIALVERESGKQARSLDDWLAIIDEYFAKYGRRAVAVKNQNAYARRLDYDAVSKDRAAPAFDGLVASWQVLGPEGVKALQDYLFRYCVQKATDYGLPVKLHTGYYAGRGPMPLSRLRQNASDLCQLLQDFPHTKFVLMHIGYPYQDEFIALAKHYPNAYVDMCWAWIINPAACIRFLKEFLMSAPANKIFTFGGDYIAVENVYGHSVIARRGIVHALSELLAGSWIGREEVESLIERIMCGNAREVFPIAMSGL